MNRSQWSGSRNSLKAVSTRRIGSARPAIGNQLKPIQQCKTTPEGGQRPARNSSRGGEGSTTACMPSAPLHTHMSTLRLLIRYIRQWRKAEDFRSRDNMRTQRARNIGTNNRPTAPKASNIVAMTTFTPVLIEDLSPWRHLTACSPCQEVGTTTIHRPSTLDQRHAQSRCAPARNL